MIRITAAEKDGKICDLRITGHAGSDVYGKDLICAAVSAIGFGLLNAVDQLVPGSKCQVTDNCISIHISRPDSLSEPVMRTGLIQLLTVAETEKQFVKVKMEAKP
jgi:uncharacterized protein YsxB (DUF464 family)